MADRNALLNINSKFCINLNIFQEDRRKREWVFFSEHSVDTAERDYTVYYTMRAKIHYRDKGVYRQCWLTSAMDTAASIQTVDGSS